MGSQQLEEDFQQLPDPATLFPPSSQQLSESLWPPSQQRVINDHDDDESQIPEPPPPEPSSSMPPPSSSNRRAARASATRFSWSRPTEEALLHTLLEAKRQGKETDNGNYRWTVWTSFIARINAVSDRPVDRDKVDNKWRRFKGLWREWKAHEESVSGWTWCPEKETYVTDHEVAEAYFLMHPDRSKFRERGPVYRLLLAELLNGRLATGNNCMTAQSAIEDSEENDDLTVGEHNQSSSPLPNTPAPLPNTPTPNNNKRKASKSLSSNQRNRRRQEEQVDDLSAIIKDFKEEIAESSSMTYKAKEGQRKLISSVTTHSITTFPSDLIGSGYMVSSQL